MEIYMRDIIKVFKTLADESRLRVLLILQERECCVCEVMQALDISQSKASRILSALYDVGILRLRKEGLWSLYSMNWEDMDKVLKDILETTITSYKSNKQALLDIERLRHAERVGPGCVEKIRREKSGA